jgi:predicted  nucleic acid-binding Zn-ribbon protein
VAEVERITTSVARSQGTIQDFQRLDAVARELDVVTHELNDLKARKTAEEAEIAALQRSVQELRGQLKSYEEAWTLRRAFMRQPDAIHADIRGAEANLDQKTAALTAVCTASRPCCSTPTAFCGHCCGPFSPLRSSGPIGKS